MRDMIAKEIKQNIVEECVSKILKNRIGSLQEFHIEPIETISKNFITKGLYRISGKAVVDNHQQTWSLILKIIHPESDEKDVPQHHNYWKREALVFQANFLVECPQNIRTPRCYAVEEKEDKSIWLYLEDIPGNHEPYWTEENLCFIAKELGEFQGVYAVGNKKLPDASWICKAWLLSWVKGCKQYIEHPAVYYEQIKDKPHIDKIFAAYEALNDELEDHLAILKKCPQTVSHQDLSKQNIFITKNNDDENQVAFIDWQFLSISALGEDLAKMFGVALSQGDIPLDKAKHYEEALFHAYIKGLALAGWKGDIQLVRYAFCISVAARSFWETPKLFKLLAHKTNDTEHSRNIKQLNRIVNLQVSYAKEAEELIHQLRF
ncbi:aminoglycoside phosphotransferase family protein [Lederbergia citri]|uniref:Phosphotransferase n=1 Tax=Lederbergia citri TaxID=2833580 RepID=A0A942YIM7_9BACI|nr:aminoglycoside phosphotransferase family protein [Lederbergia citri]MBS4196640.1 phosphotransferase [Lederbergia citri]